MHHRGQHKIILTNGSTLRKIFNSDVSFGCHGNFNRKSDANRPKILSIQLHSKCNKVSSFASNAAKYRVELGRQRIPFHSTSIKYYNSNCLVYAHCTSFIMFPRLNRGNN